MIDNETVVRHFIAAWSRLDAKEARQHLHRGCHLTQHDGKATVYGQAAFEAFVKVCQMRYECIWSRKVAREERNNDTYSPPQMSTSSQSFRCCGDGHESRGVTQVHVVLGGF